MITSLLRFTALPEHTPLAAIRRCKDAHDCVNSCLATSFLDIPRFYHSRRTTMLHLALAALLAGSLGTGAIAATPDDDKDKTPRAEAAVGLTTAEEAPVTSSYAFGQTERTFLKVWAGYAWGQDDEFYDGAGNEQPLGFELTSQRAFVGAQVNLLNLTNFSIGVGGELAFVNRELNEFDTGWGTQQARVFAEVRGRVLGVHGGYIFDLGDDPVEGEPFGRSDLSDAIFVGASFDYPATWLRLFGGIDYYSFQDVDGGTGWDNPALLVFNMGAGVRISWVEIGAAGIIRTNTVVNRFGAGGSHQGSIAPYLRVSPPALPISLSVRGAFTDEYTDYGYSVGGSRDLATHLGFTAAITYGF